MTVIDDLTPTQYGLEDGKLIIRGTSVADLDFRLLVYFYNAVDRPLDHRYISLTFTPAQKQIFIDAISAEIASLEAATGLTKYTLPPPIGP